MILEIFLETTIYASLASIVKLKISDTKRLLHINFGPAI